MSFRRASWLLQSIAVLLALPAFSFAQQPERVWHIGILDVRQRPQSIESHPLYGQFLRRLRELGYVESKNVSFEWRFAAGDYGRLQGMAADLVGRRVDVIVTAASDGIRAAQEATSKIPIVFVGGTDVVAQGYVKSLAHPGGNTTGFTLLFGDTIGKQLELLTTAVPKLSRLAILVNSANSSMAMVQKDFQRAAEAAKVQILFFDARTPQEIEGAFLRAAKEHPQALIWAVDAFFIQQQRQIAELAERYRLPSTSGTTEYPEVGGLMGYGPNRPAIWRRIAEYVDRIFKGANPGDLPVQEPTTLALVINRKTSKALGLEIPPELLLQADRVIE